MKSKNLFAVIGLASVCLSLAVSPARAALTYSPGDLLMGFYALSGQGSSESVVINLGPASTFRDFSGSFFDLSSVGSIKADLDATFGTDWNTRADVKWGVFGTTYTTAVGSDPIHTLYAGKAELTIGTVTTPYNRGSAATQSQPATKIHDLGDAYADGTAALNSKATVQLSSINNDFAQFQTNNGTLSFGSFNMALGNFGSGTAGTAVDLFRMETGSSTLKGTYEGTFTINDAGMIRFTAVPEPSAWALLVLGAGVGATAFFRRRRRETVAA